MQNPKISVVLPTYNGEKYIRESIDSIINQTYQDWELIIIDDCSTDSTPQILENYAAKDNRIITYRNATNLKLPASLNKGFSIAKGTYFTWTSDDNIYLPEAFSLMVGLLERNSNVDLVYCNTQRIDSHGHLLRSKNYSFGKYTILFYNAVQACFLYRHSLHQELDGYDTAMFLVEDYDFWLRARRTHNFQHIKSAPYYYREHQDSLTSKRICDIRSKAIALLKRERSQSSYGLLEKIILTASIIYNSIQLKVQTRKAL